MPYSKSPRLLYSRALLLCALVLFAFPALAQPVRIGVVDLQQLERESSRPKRDAENLKKEFAAREQSMRDMQARVVAMRAEVEKLKPEAPDFERRQRAFTDLAQQYEQTRRAFVEDVDRRRMEERQRFLNDARAAVLKVAQARKLDLVLEQAAYASRAVNITGDVIKAIDAGTGKK